MTENKKVATREAYGEALQQLAANENVVVLDADLSGSTKTNSFAKVCPSASLTAAC